MSAREIPVAKPTPIRIFETIQGYQRAYALKAAVELDVFTAIAQGSHTAAEIARTSNASERGVRILCDAMVVMGLLTKSGDRYSLTQDTAFFLDRESPAYLGHALKFLMHPTQLIQVSTFAGIGAARRTQPTTRARWLRKIPSGWNSRAAWRP